MHLEGNVAAVSHGRDGFAVIVKKGEPSTSGFWILGCAFHPARDGSFRDIETQHEKLAVNPRSTPGGVLPHNLENQMPELLGQLLPSDSPSHPGDQTPVQAEAGAMPADHGLGVTTTRACFQADQKRRASTQKSLSRGLRLGRGCLRLSTASCFRSAKFSSRRLCRE